ncbi:BlaI/MecI/CopY family transcriptional regulator [Streptomyces caniferus]|uniref:BlaI/MecI/CopY family transcriptional regulator n=1 Tax=Streptomyces caniferus TaxID=285557 RepID=UPI002E2C7E2F|nr:BlaI/MecI/CopY family transcriptional regulator [Streptomyces caniferus]
MPRFGELEAEIMDQVWAADEPVRARDVLTRMERERPLAYNSVQTVMENLLHKGWLTKERDGRAFRYRATATREQYAARLMDEALAVTPERTAALARFVEDMVPDEAAALAQALEAARATERDRS